ncbi:MAG: hypothetical protein KAV82_06075 [Phycisphaerae bacterium]|nr:hypothetical protein [Phycisphaerae bacterium]
MRMRQKVSATVGLIGFACLGVAAPPDVATGSSTVADTGSKARGMEETSYTLCVDSIFAQGCMGSVGMHYGCMCPMRGASEFTGSLTLTPTHHVPPGHQAFDVTVQDWLVTFDGEEMEITGDGYYDKWSAPDGSRWHILTLDLYIHDEEAHLSSGLVENPPPGDAFPSEINIDLESEPACFGYWIVLEAKRLPAARPTRPAAESAVEGAVDANSVTDVDVSDFAH